MDCIDDHNTINMKHQEKDQMDGSNVPMEDSSSPNRTKTRVAVIGAGAAGMACAWSLSRHSDTFDVTVLEELREAGGVASTSTIRSTQPGAPEEEDINDQVQGGAPSYRNNLLFFKEFGFEPHEVEFKIAFGTGEYAWKNYGEQSELVKRLQKDIERFGKVLKMCYRFEPIFVFIPIHKVLKWWGFSEEFQTRMVFPLTALFFGTGNQTPYVSAAVIARVFLDPELRLFEYSSTSLLDQVPKMFAFPKLGTIFSTIAAEIPARVLTSARVERIERDVSVTTDTGKKKKCVRVYSQAFNGGCEEFDEVVLCCGAEQALKLLGSSATRMEKKFLGNVSYYNDLIVTHEDEEYMKSYYEFDPQQDMYFIRCDPADPKLIEMSFNLTSYQPHIKRDSRNIYQSIFLDDSNKTGWTDTFIHKGKVLKERMTRQFAHTWKHFAFWVPFVRFLQGTKHTWYAGSYTLFNTHEIAVMSGLAAADRLGAKYPFSHDSFALKQYKTYFKMAHGLFASRTK